MDIDRQRMTKIVEVRLRLPKILTARCVMLANITAFGRPASGFLTRLWLDESAARAGKEEGKAMPTCKVQESRDRKRPLKVVVSERERAEIETRAAATGLSVSAYLRNLGLGFQPQSTLDHEAVLALLKVNADQGRLGGLFKLWLSGQCAPSAETVEIRTLLTAIEDCQLQLSRLSSSTYRDFDVLRKGNCTILSLCSARFAGAASRS